MLLMLITYFSCNNILPIPKVNYFMLIIIRTLVFYKLELSNFIIKSWKLVMENIRKWIW